MGPGDRDGAASCGIRDGGPRREALAFQMAGVEVERRPLDVYEAVAMGAQR